MFNKKRPYGLYNRYKLHEKGLEKFTKEFDAEYFAKSLRLLKVLLASTLDDSERFMTVYQHCNSLSLAKSDSETDSENEALKDMPGYLCKKQEDVDQHRDNIRKFLQAYFKERHTPKDLKMLKGAFTKQKLKNDQLKKFNLSRGSSYDEELQEHENHGDKNVDEQVFSSDDNRTTGHNFAIQARIIKKKTPRDKRAPLEDEE